MSKSTKVKDRPVNRRIQNLVDQHVQMLAREIAEELARPFLGQLIKNGGQRFPHEEDDSTLLSLPGELPILLPRQRKWLCPRCTQFSDFQRRAVSTHLRFCRPEQPEHTGPLNCAQCSKEFETRAKHDEHLRLTCSQCHEEFKTEAQRDGHLRWCGKDPKKVMIRICIKPGCKKHNRGPRYRYLCKIHERASERQVERWRKERAERSEL